MSPSRSGAWKAPILARAFLLCVFLAACSTPPEVAPPASISSVPAPTVHVGQSWEYSVRDGYTGLPRGLYRHTVARVDADRFVVDIAHDAQQVDSWIYSQGWNGLELPLTNLQRVRFAPPFAAFDFPLYPGKNWRRIVNATDPSTGRTYRVHIHATVTGWRRMRVPAGEFDALEVRRQVWAGNAEFFKLQEEINQTDWYAPEVGYVVASESSSSHVDTSRSGGGRGRPLRVRGDWLIAELARRPVR